MSLLQATAGMEEQKCLVVVGSVNADMVLEVDRLPADGETLGAKTLNTFPGGKASSQCIAHVHTCHSLKSAEAHLNVRILNWSQSGEGALSATFLTICLAGKTDLPSQALQKPHAHFDDMLSYPLQREWRLCREQIRPLLLQSCDIPHTCLARRALSC